MNSTISLNSNKKPKVGRPINCFMAFRLEKHQEISLRTPGLNHRDISKIIAKWWKEMSEEEKAPYRAIAAKAKAEHELRYPNYIYKPIKKSQRRVRPYHRREDIAVRQRKAQKNDLRLKQWLGEGPDTIPCLSPTTSTTSTLQNSPISSFSSASSNFNTNFDLCSPLTAFSHTDYDLPFFAPDLFSSYDSTYYDPSPQSCLFFDFDASIFTECGSLFSTPVDLAAWTSSVDIISPSMVTPDQLSLEMFLQL